MSLKLFLCITVTVIMTALAIGFTSAIIISDIHNYSIIYAWR